MPLIWDDSDPGWTLGSEQPVTRIGALVFWLLGMLLASFIHC